MIWLITDTHIGHKAITKMSGRPTNFEQQIFRNWKKSVKESDTVIHLGDVAWDNATLVKTMKLPGRKILIKGNHDKKTTMEYMDAGFALVVPELRMDFDGLKILFTHRPRPDHDADINIHGHNHDLHRSYDDCLYWPLSIEQTGYKPIALDMDFVNELKKWKKCFFENGYKPDLGDIMSFRQHAEPPRLRDIVGRATKHAEQIISIADQMILLNPPRDIEPGTRGFANFFDKACGLVGGCETYLQYIEKMDYREYDWEMKAVKMCIEERRG